MLRHYLDIHLQKYRKPQKNLSGKAIPGKHLLVNCTHSESRAYYYCTDLHHLL